MRQQLTCLTCLIQCTNDTKTPGCRIAIINRNKLRERQQRYYQRKREQLTPVQAHKAGSERCETFK